MHTKLFDIPSMKDALYIACIKFFFLICDAFLYSFFKGIKYIYLLEVHDNITYHCQNFIIIKHMGNITYPGIQTIPQLWLIGSCIRKHLNGYVSARQLFNK